MIRRIGNPAAALRVALLLVACVLGPSCASPAVHARAEGFAANGIYVRHLRVRVAPAKTRAFEAIMARCVAVATAAELDGAYEWLCYREPPGRYWLLMFSRTNDGFAAPGTLAGFVEHFDRIAAQVGDERGGLVALLDGLEFEREWELVFQQKSSWSSVEHMHTATHPKARMIDRTVRPGMEAAFEEALAGRTAFFVEHGFPLPIHGFVVRSGAPGRAIQVVFPVDWPSFHRSDSFFAFSKRLDQAGQDAYAAHKAALMPTMASAEYYDGDFVDELSYGGP